MMIGSILGKAVSPVVSDTPLIGPNKLSPGIRKPNIIGSGVSILAGWPPYMTPTGDGKDERRVFFNLKSGTLMSTPHLREIAAALLKAAHPEWSPAAIKSAMMTTADVLDNKGKPIKDFNHEQANVFAVGVDHVNPNKAVDWPGL
ncbi:hypothetical protein AMTR_s00073p00081080 [Amborella trichopoda]|uniref:Peptidase S8/S53 domain-containing protein n=1 Tax=Amborella trichopoda TaxID=13333 RepID=W1NNN0_AMBTC|nr:hypothetical protein AMTR_s00073p00081080 [Amborella trichopoda]